MKTLELQQGSFEWHEHRYNHFNASDASAMMGVSPYKTRNELLKEYATGIRPEVTESQQFIFNKGHKAESAALSVIEAEIDEDLFPVVGVCDSDPKLSSSFDGLTMLGDLVWECKLYSQEKEKHVQAGCIPPQDRWQLVHQMVVSGAKKVLYTISDENAENILSCELEYSQEDADKLLAGWKQFEEDLAAFTESAPEAEVVGKTPDSLPALHIEVTGMVSASNLPAFKEHALAVFDGINTDLQTDEDFADAEKTVKWCKDVEDRLGAAKQHALSQTESIDELFRAIDSIREEARQKRLTLDKAVKSRKEAIRVEILAEYRQLLMDHVAQINETFGGKIRLPQTDADFAGVMKGKKTVTSLRSACDDELARVKIESNQVADKIRINLETLRTDAKDYETLFADAQQLVLKDNDDLKAVIKSRIADHKEQEAKREAERKQAEESKPEPVKQEAPPVETKREPVQESPKAASVTRPTDDQIIMAVAASFSVDADTAIDWIRGVQQRAAA